MSSKAIATSSGPSPSDASKKGKSKSQSKRRERNWHRRRALKREKKKIEKLLASSSPAVCAVPCVECVEPALSHNYSGLYEESGRCSHCWRCPSGHTCIALEPHVIPMAIRLTTAIEAAFPNKASSSKKYRASRKASRREIPELRAAVRALMKIPVGEFAAADTTSASASSTSPTAAPNSPDALLVHDVAQLEIF
ncbi:hypothetical protein GGR58DRAFT_529650 [Xylaria digitata]|nr:hypothetical protein GGR58DRAFT_529650 [Xylaria digitata]